MRFNELPATPVAGATRCEPGTGDDLLPNSNARGRRRLDRYIDRPSRPRVSWNSVTPRDHSLGR